MLINFFPSKSLMSGSLSALQHYLSGFFHQLYVASSCCMHRLQSFGFWIISWIDYCYPFLIGLLSLPLECIHNGVAQFWLILASHSSPNQIHMLLLGPYTFHNPAIPKVICLFTKKTNKKKTCMDHIYGVISTDEVPIYLFFSQVIYQLVKATDLRHTLVKSFLEQTVDKAKKRTTTPI